MPRRLAPEEAALWARVAATVRPMRGRALAKAAPVPPPAAPEPKPLAKAKRPAAPLPAVSAPVARPARISVAAATLDGSWDRRLGGGIIAPERTVDLHDHNLAAAHFAMEDAIEAAIADGVRVLLIITGKGRGARPGVIRAQLGDWLDASPHRRRIAALRPAHPRHGGGGAFYLVLRRSG